MNIENVDGVDLYADVDEFGPDMDHQEMDLYDDMSKLNSSHRLANSGFTAKHYPLIISNLTWWTSDQDLIDALTGIGVTDLIEIKFHENRVNGQSKGFATVAFATETSSRVVLEKLPRKEIHGQNITVAHCNAATLRQLDAASKKEPVSNGQKAKPTMTTTAKTPGQQPLLGSSAVNQPIITQIQYQLQPTSRMLVPPPATPNTAVPPPNMPQAPITLQTHRPFHGQTNVPPPMLGQPMQMMQTPMQPHALQIINRAAPPPALSVRGQVLNLRMPMGHLEIRGGLQPMRPPGTTNQFNQPPPGHQFAPMRQSMGQVIVQPQGSIFTMPPGMVAVQHPMHQIPAHSVAASIAQMQHINQPIFAPTSQPQMQNNPPGVPIQADLYGRPIAAYVPPTDPYQHPKVALQPPERPAHYASPEKPRRKISQSRSPSYPSGGESYRDRRNSPPPIREIAGASYRDRRDSPPPGKEIRRDSSASMQLSDIDFDDILQRNKTVSSSAISRAVQDARAGEYASAIETLVTAISLIKQSRIANDDRCRILISSLQDTLHGIESKSYGSKYDPNTKSSTRISRERRSRSPRDRSEKHIISTSSSRHRSRSREREYTDRSRDKERHHYEIIDRHREKDRSERDYRESRRH